MDLFAPWHLVILIGAILLMFGGKKIPEMMSGIGKGMKDFKKSIKEEGEKVVDEPKQTPKSDSFKNRLKQ